MQVVIQVGAPPAAGAVPLAFVDRNHDRLAHAAERHKDLTGNAEGTIWFASP